MTKYVAYLGAIVLLFFSSSCEKIEEDAVLYEADYRAKTDEDQTFYYFYDDGEWVSDALDRYMCKLSSTAGTFSEEASVFIEMNDSIPLIGDSLVPFTYFLGVNYPGTLQLPIQFAINGNYQFNLPAHLDYNEYQFMMNNLDQLQLFELTFEDNYNLYDDPDFEMDTIPFTIDSDSNLIQFETQKLNAMYGLCYEESEFNDTISFQVNIDGGNSNQSVHSGYRKSRHEGAVYYGRDLEIDYFTDSEVSSSNTNIDGWYFRELHMDIKNPVEGVINHEDINFICLAQKNTTGFPVTSYIELLTNTTVEITSWPELNEYGTLSITGIVKVGAVQTSTPINMEIKFRRLR